MDHARLPADVLELISRHLDCMEQVQALLLLRKEPERWWQVAEVSREVRSSTEKIAGVLSVLHRNKLVALAPGEPTSYRYSPATDALRTAVDHLDIAYNTLPVTLVKALYERPPRSIQSFADAFRLRKPEDEA